MTTRQQQKIKAIVMFSGGLDSSLAVRILQEEGVEVEALHFTGAFHAGKFDEYDSSAKRFAEKFGVKLTIFKIEDDFINILENPRYGYGSNMNPCIDCRIYTLKKAKKYMEEAKAFFIATGEVLGQRPMSQRKDTLELIAKRSGLDGLLLRPLSAKLLKPTIPEERVWIDREKLFDISGRSRKLQMALADRYGIKNYPTPAGGCLLTDPQFSVRLKDLVKHSSLTLDDIELLKVGRHFRLSGDTKAIVGRNQDDNSRILELVKENDIVLKLKDIPGPLTILKGKPTEKDIEIAGTITARYSKAKQHDAVEASYYVVDSNNKAESYPRYRGKENSFPTTPAEDGVIRKYMI